MNSLNTELTQLISDLLPEAGLMELGFGCACNPDEVKPQEYQRAITVMVPEYIPLYRNDGTGDLRKTVSIDACLVSEILDLWRKGIRTTGCCCGHNQEPPFIGVMDSHIQEMKNMGYKVAPNPMDAAREDSFYPKSLGHEPLLRHVLWALGRYAEKTKTDIVGVCNRSIRPYVQLGAPTGVRYLWNLQHNLYGQSEETKTFILNLLKG